MTALRTRYSPPEYAFLPQVRNATGFAGKRTADAVAMSLYPSRGLYLHGFEVKVSRGDWRRELKDPEKAEEIARFCHFWWIVAPQGVVDAHDLPPDWGLLVLNKGGKLHVERQAPQTAADPITYPFLASILRKVQESTIPRSVYGDQIAAARVEIEERAAKNVERKVEDLRARLEHWEDFSRLSGITVRSWDYGHVGEAVKQIMNERVRPGYVRDGLFQIKEDLERIQCAVDASLKRIEEQDES
jgi:hypothetical protein